MFLDPTEYAEVVLPLGASHEDWLYQRTQGIGGSDVSAIMGLSNYAAPWKVWLDKTGRAPKQKPTLAMRMGNHLESAVRSYFIEETGIDVALEGTLRSKSNPVMQYNPDGLTDDAGLFEAKTSTSWLAHEWEGDQVPDHAELQVQEGMGVTGAGHAWVCGLLDGRTPFIRRIERDQGLIDTIFERCEAFWQTYVVADVEPPVQAQDLSLLKDMHPVARPLSELALPEWELRVLRGQYEEAHEKVKMAEEEKEAAQARIRRAAGDAEALVDEQGRKWVTLKSGGKLSESRFITENPDLAEQLGERKLTVSAAAVKKHDLKLWEQYVPRALRLPKITD